MATKTGIIANINGFITAIITQLKVRNAYLELVNEMYRQTTTESFTNLADNTPLTTPNGTTHYYSFQVDKIGNHVFWGGTLTNKTGATLANGTWLSISSTEFLQNSDVVKFNAVSASDGRNLTCLISSNNLIIVSPINNNETVNFNVKYNTNN
jgi:hypothetical protein